MKKTGLFACILVICNLTLLAQTENRPRVLHTPEKSAIHVPPQEPPAGLKKIYSDLGKSKVELYYDASGWLLSGPNSQIGFNSFIALPFIPKSDSHVSQVQAAVLYQGSGANQVNLSIYGDANFAPGTLLAGPVTVTNLPDSGTCCTLAVADFTPLAVTGGARYWVVVDTPLTGIGSDFQGNWAFSVKPAIPLADNIADAGWSATDGNQVPAGEVLGTVP